MPEGYYTDYSYRGRMPDGNWKIFVSESEYLEAFYEEIEDL